jgi:uncharacterized protein YecE (DUF72 family)
MSLPFPDEFDRPPLAAKLARTLRELASQGIYIGGSSWKYAGWLGSIYTRKRYLTRGKHSQAKFDRECLAEYVQTFATVGGDFSFYQFPGSEFWSNLFDQLPADFRIGLKVPEDVTVAKWPGHARYGKRAGEVNDAFLDAKVFDTYFTERLAPYVDRLGPLIFEFGTFPKAVFRDLEDFMAALDPFLAALPEGYRYGVEIRNPEYLKPAYLDLLASHNVAHVLNAWTRMPGLEDQVQLPFTADFTVVRALLRKGRLYEKAVEAFEPYAETQEVNEEAREALVEIARKSLGRRKPAFLFVNNRLEGFAPGTIEFVADRLCGSSEGR